MKGAPFSHLIRGSSGAGAGEDHAQEMMELDRMAQGGETQTPMSDHIARFWQLLRTEHVRVLVDIRREHDEYQDSGVRYHWDSASFSDDVAKALVKERDAEGEQMEDE